MLERERFLRTKFCLLANSREMEEKLFVASTDLEKVYDRVKREEL